MNVPVARAGAPGDDRAVEFSGHWREFLPIALTNLVLTIITLGIYRFWAKARVRRYLWSRTDLIGSPLEWTGTGGEMFVGFLMAIGVLLGWFALAVGGGIVIGEWFMFVGLFAFYIFFLWAFGFAQFRALRYRLSRTYWRGIRGGSDDNGVHYGWTALGNNILAGLTLGILTPRAITENWNDRIRAMSFGPHQLESDVDTVGLQSRWMMLYAVYIGFFVLVAAFGGEPDEVGTGTDLIGLASVALLFLGLALVMIGFWALFFRKAAEAFSMNGLTASFDVTTYEWIEFYAKLVGLTVVTLGFGFLFWGFWRWQFTMDRLALFGVIDLDSLTQLQTEAPKDAEGFADAFDIGAF